MDKEIHLEDIIISRNFKQTTPSGSKLEKCRDYYKRNGTTDKRILVDRNNVLIDGYIRYLVLKENEDKVGIVTVNVLPNKYFKYNTFYIFGRHPNTKKEYVWRLPICKESEVEKYRIGGKALVWTKYGARKIVITKVEAASSPPVKTPIRKVIRCLES